MYVCVSMHHVIYIINACMDVCMHVCMHACMHVSLQDDEKKRMTTYLLKNTTALIKDVARILGIELNGTKGGFYM
jgi:HD superfamily phosphohydrolase